MDAKKEWKSLVKIVCRTRNSMRRITLVIRAGSPEPLESSKCCNWKGNRLDIQFVGPGNQNPTAPSCQDLVVENLWSSIASLDKTCGRYMQFAESVGI